MPNTATEKLARFGMARIAQGCGVNLSSVYRWAKQLDRGQGLKDSVKLQLIQITRGSEDALDWADFDPRRNPELA